MILIPEKSDIPFSDILSFYELTTRDDEEGIKQSKTAVIEHEDEAKTLERAHHLRTIDPALPLLILIRFASERNSLLIRKIPGYGPVRILHYRKEYTEQILEGIEGLLHQEYPTERKDIALILPVYNEAQRIDNVYDFLQKLRLLMEKSFLNSTIYFVNDGSSDNTSQLIDRLIEQESNDVEILQKDPFFSIRNLSENTRKAGTYIGGIQQIKADILIFADADDSFVIEDIAKMINILHEGYFDMVVGTKDLSAENRPPIRKLMSFAKRVLTKFLLPEGVYDSQTGLKALNSVCARHILHHLHADTGLAVDLEMLYLARILRFRVLQLPVTCIDREGSHVDIIHDSINFIKNIIRIPRMNKGVKYGRD